MNKLNKKAFGIATGVLAGVYFLVLGVFATYFGWGVAMVEMFGSVYLGYAPTLLGTLIGTAEALIDGFIAGWILAYLYNKFAA